MGETTTAMRNAQCVMRNEKVFRRMTIDDADEVAALDLKCFGERDAWSSYYFFYAAQEVQAEYFVGELDGKIIACAGAEIFSDAAEIETFAVAPEYRRQRIGTELFAKLLAAIKVRGASLIFLEVRPSNSAAINFYATFGFQIVDRVKNFYVDEDALIMMREI